MKDNQIKIVNSAKAPKAIGPYSQAIVFENFIFCSGQIGINPETGELVSGLENQTNQVLKNLNNILVEIGSSKDKVIKTTIFLTDINNFAKVNSLYEQFFGNHKPSRSTVEVSSLPKGALIEIEAIAYR